MTLTRRDVLTAALAVTALLPRGAAAARGAKGAKTMAEPSSTTAAARMPVPSVGHGNPMNAIEDKRWSRAFDDEVAAALSQHDTDALVRLLGRERGRLAAPTPDHYLPLLHAFPTNHNPRFAPVLQPTLRAGVEAAVAAAQAWLAP